MIREILFQVIFWLRLARRKEVAIYSHGNRKEASVIGVTIMSVRR